jgi:hypothetical protein
MYYYGGIDPETLLQTELNPQCVCLFEYQLVKKKTKIVLYYLSLA